MKVVSRTEPRAVENPDAEALDYYITELGIDAKVVLDIYGRGRRRGAEWADRAWGKMLGGEKKCHP